MRLRSTIILLVILLGLGAYTYWVEIPKAQQEAKKKTLFEFKPDDATAVSLVYTDREIDLKKSGTDWRLTKPLEALADPITVKNLVRAITDCEIKKTLEHPAALAEYGLDKPFVKVSIQVKGKALPVILVGKNTPVGFSTYVQKAGDTGVLLTSSAFRSGMDKTATELRDKTIVTFLDKDVQKVALHANGQDMTLAQKDGAWTIDTPGPYKADATIMRTFLSTLRSLRAVDFPATPSDPSTYGLDKPRLTVTLYLGKNNAEKTLDLGKDTDKKQVYVEASGNPPAYYAVSDWVFTDLNKNVGDFRDKTVLAFARAQATALAVQRADGTRFKLARGADTHGRPAGVAGTPLQTTIADYVSDVHQLQGYKILADHPADLSAFGLDHPLLTITVFGKDNKPLGTALVARHSASGKTEYTAMAQGGPTVFQVRDYLATRLDKRAEDFVEKPPTPTHGPAATRAAK